MSTTINRSEPTVVRMSFNDFWDLHMTETSNNNNNINTMPSTTSDTLYPLSMDLSIDSSISENDSFDESLSADLPITDSNTLKRAYSISPIGLIPMTSTLSIPSLSISSYSMDESNEC